MKIEYMREYIELSKTKNFSRASEILFISQPALSKHMVLIESELGIQLLERSHHSVEFTPIGMQVLAEFKKIVSLYDSLTNKIDEKLAGISGELTLGIQYYAVNRFISPVIKKFREHYPNVSIRTISAQPDRILDDLIEEKIDIGFLSHDPVLMPISYENILIQKLVKEPLSVICGPQNMLAQHKKIYLSDLNGQKYIWYRNGILTDKQCCFFKNFFLANNIKFEDSYYIDNIDLLTSMIVDTNGISLLPHHIIDHHLNLCCVEFECTYSLDMCIASNTRNSNPAVSLLSSVALQLFSS